MYEKERKSDLEKRVEALNQVDRSYFDAMLEHFPWLPEKMAYRLSTVDKHGVKEGVDGRYVKLYEATRDFVDSGSKIKSPNHRSFIKTHFEHCDKPIFQKDVAKARGLPGSGMYVKIEDLLFFYDAMASGEESALKYKRSKLFSGEAVDYQAHEAFSNSIFKIHKRQEIETKIGNLDESKGNLHDYVSSYINNPQSGDLFKQKYKQLFDKTIFLQVNSLAKSADVSDEARQVLTQINSLGALIDASDNLEYLELASESDNFDVQIAHLSEFDFSHNPEIFDYVLLILAPEGTTSIETDSTEKKSVDLKQDSFGYKGVSRSQKSSETSGMSSNITPSFRFEVKNTLKYLSEKNGVVEDFINGFGQVELHKVVSWDDVVEHFKNTGHNFDQMEDDLVDWYASSIGLEWNSSKGREADLWSILHMLDSMAEMKDQWISIQSKTESGIDNMSASYQIDHEEPFVQKLKSGILFQANPLAKKWGITWGDMFKVFKVLNISDSSITSYKQTLSLDRDEKKEGVFNINRFLEMINLECTEVLPGERVEMLDHPVDVICLNDGSRAISRQAMVENLQQYYQNKKAGSKEARLELALYLRDLERKDRLFTRKLALDDRLVQIYPEEEAIALILETKNRLNEKLSL